MDISHPDMQRAACEVPAGFQQAPVIAAMQQLRAVNATLRTINDNLRAINDTQRVALAGYNAPPCPADQFLHIHTHAELGALDCHLTWEEGDPEVGWAEQVTLCAAYMCGREISGRLTPSEVEAIEIEATKCGKQSKRDHIPLEAELIGAELDAESLEQGEPA